MVVHDFEHARSAKAVERFGRVDILVNNAGVSWGAMPEDMTLEQWQRVIDVNLTGCFLFAQAAGREMLEAFLRAPETSNARDVEHAHQSEIEYVPLDDPLVAVNVDTPEQYASLNLPPQLLPSS